MVTVDNSCLECSHANGIYFKKKEDIKHDDK